MKRLMTFMLGLAFLTTTVCVVHGQGTERANSGNILSKQRQEKSKQAKPTTRPGVVHPDEHPGHHWRAAKTTPTVAPPAPSKQ